MGFCQDPTTETDCNASYAALVQRDFKLLDVSNVRIDCSVSKVVFNADMVVAGYNFHPAGVFGMSERLIVAAPPAIQT